MNAIIDPRESYRVAYDLTAHKDIYPHGDVIVVMTWNVITGKPVMVLVNKGIISNQRVVPCVITLDNAWRWDEGSQGMMSNFATGERVEDWQNITAAIFCANLGFSPYNRKNVIRIMGVIREHLGDLIAMPPMSDERAEVAAEMIIRDNATGKTIEKEVRDNA